jgi:hypothetical protein
MLGAKPLDLPEYIHRCSLPFNMMVFYRDFHQQKVEEKQSHSRLTKE